MEQNSVAGAEPPPRGSSEDQEVGLRSTHVTNTSLFLEAPSETACQHAKLLQTQVTHTCWEWL